MNSHDDSNECTIILNCKKILIHDSVPPDSFAEFIAGVLFVDVQSSPDY